MSFNKQQIYNPQKEDPDGPKPIKGNLFLLPRSPVPWGILSDRSHVKCGYCGKDIRTFSNRVYLPGDKRPYPKWYNCHAGCEDSMRQRVQFIDKYFVKWMKNRITDKVRECNSGFDLNVVMGEFSKLSKIEMRRRELQTALHITGHNTESIVKQLIEVEKEYNFQKVQLDIFDPLPFPENPMVCIMMKTPLEQLLKMDINYLRKMFDFMVNSVRFFREYVLVRAVPITEREFKITEGFGPQSSINLRATHRLPGSGM